MACAPGATACSTTARRTSRANSSAQNSNSEVGVLSGAPCAVGARGVLRQRTTAASAYRRRPCRHLTTADHATGTLTRGAQTEPLRNYFLHGNYGRDEANQSTASEPPAHDSTSSRKSIRLRAPHQSNTLLHCPGKNKQKQSVPAPKAATKE